MLLDFVYSGKGEVVGSLGKDGMGQAVQGHYTACKVFSATKAREREELGETVTRWLNDSPGIRVVHTVVTQSSDNEFHCLTITIFYDGS